MEENYIKPSINPYDTEIVEVANDEYAKPSEINKENSENFIAYTECCVPSDPIAQQEQEEDKKRINIMSNISTSNDEHENNTRDSMIQELLDTLEEEDINDNYVYIGCCDMRNYCCSFILFFTIFMMPVLGFVLYFVYRRRDNDMADRFLKISLLSVFIWALYILSY